MMMRWQGVLSFRVPALVPRSATASICVRFARRASTAAEKRVVLDLSATTGRLILPLSKFLCSFHLTPEKTVGELEKEVAAEDPTLVGQFHLFLDGARVGHNTPFGHVLRDMRTHHLPLVAEIGKISHPVITRDEQMVVQDDCGSEISIVQDYRKAVSDVKKKAGGALQMPLQEFVDALQKAVGTTVNEKEMQRVLRCLHGAKSILHFHKEPSLKDVVFLHPDEVERRMRLALDAKNPVMLEQEKVKVQRDLATLRRKLEPMTDVKVVLDAKADKFARRCMWAGFGYAVTQLTIIARLTWWELSWDVMEPISYVLGASNVALFFFFYQVTSFDPSYPSLQEFIKGKRQLSLYKKNNFDLKRYNEIQRAIAILEDEEDPETRRINMARRLAAKVVLEDATAAVAKSTAAAKKELSAAAASVVTPTPVVAAAASPAASPASSPAAAAKK